jgi:hypothetical protein
LERLREVLEYDPDSGVWIWVGRTGNKSKPGKIAGSLDNNGYVVIRIDRAIYKAHRLAWLYMTGEWPKVTVDHINNVPADNRWTNLREATYSQNNASRGLTVRNSSGFKGVYWQAKNKKWVATIAVGDNRIRYLGSFDRPEDAHAAYCAAAQLRFGEFFKKE